jgi:acetyltransferase-like isoleucine patch superfamily enzyme
MLLIKIYEKFLQIWWSISVPLRLKLIGVKVGKNVKFYGLPIVNLHENSEIIINDNAVLCSDSRFTALGVSHPVILRTLCEGAKIIIGKGVGLSGTSICAAKSVLIGDNCLIGSNVLIVDTDFHTINPVNRRFNKSFNDIKSGSVVLGKNVFVGAGAYLLKDVTIGDNSVIGAASVVTKNVSSDVIVAGNPSKFICNIPN